MIDDKPKPTVPSGQEEVVIEPDQVQHDREFQESDFPEPQPEENVLADPDATEEESEEKTLPELQPSRLSFIPGYDRLRYRLRLFIFELMKADETDRSDRESHIDISEVIGTDRLIRRGGLFAMTCLSVFVAWAVFAPLSEGIIASGQVIVESRRKSIQHLEGGIVAEIYVTEGSEVEADELLLRLEDTTAKANFALLESRLYSQVAQFDRLQAEREGLDEIAFSDEILGEIEEQNPKVLEIVAQQREIFISRSSRVTGETEILSQRISQLEELGRGLAVQLVSLEDRQNVVLEELTRLESLRKQNVIDLTTLSAKQKEASSVGGEVGRLRSDIAGNQVAIAEAKSQQLQIKRELQQEISKEILLVQDYILETREQLANATAVLERTSIRSPQRGKVLNLRVFTIGGVIPPGEVIMEIVPVEDDLVVESQVIVTDIDNVYVGQPVRALLSAFNTRTTPELNGFVEFIGADVQYDPQGIMPPHYTIRVNFTEAELSRLPSNVVIKPGMPVETFIQGQQRTALKYLMAPISEGIRRSLVE